MGDRYFVRSSEGAPEKGPFSPAQLVKSQENALLGKQAVVRLDGSEEWLPLRDVVASILAARAEKKAMRNSPEMEHAMAAIPSGRPPNALLWLGVVVGLAGVAFTVGFAASGESRHVWPVGMILGGVFMAVRGLIRASRSRDDE